MTALITGAFISCEDYLEETPTGKFTTETTLTSTESGEALANGCYRNLTEWLNAGTDDWGGWTYAGMEYLAGKAASQYQGARLWMIESDAIDGEQAFFKNPWQYWFRGVQDCNNAIQMLPNIAALSETMRNQYLGEARALRAHYYFYLVKYYGDVPLITEPVKDAADSYRPRTSLKTIYDEVIVPDLQFALENTKEGRSTDGRITKDVARAMLADVYMTMAGYPYQEVATNPDKAWCTEGSWAMTEYPVNSPSAKQFMESAKSLLDQLYGKYTPYALTDLHEPSTNNNTGGCIWQYQYLAGTRNFPCQYMLPLTYYGSCYSTECGTNIPSTAYYNSYDPADLRLVDRNYFFYSDTKAKKYDPNEGPCTKFAYAYLYKWYDTDAIKNTNRSGLNWNAYRYCDILLMLTEVNWTLRQLGSNVSDNDIVKGINEVRKRAGLSEFTTNSLTLKDIMAERAYELVWENKLLWDMRRTRKALVDGSGEFTRLENFVGYSPTSFSYAFTAKHLLAPISATEIYNNYEVQQNYGWSPVQSQSK